VWRCGGIIMAGRLEHLKLLNMDRWRAHLQARTEATEATAATAAATTAGGDSDATTLALPPMGHPMPVPTAGELFNRPDPVHDGHFVKPYNRKNDRPEPNYRTHKLWISPRDYRRVAMPSQPGTWQETRQAVPTSGDDFTSVPLFSPYKYRVPVTSVTRKQGDCKLFCCCGWRWTAAQWSRRSQP